MKVSVIIPAHNEEKYIAPTLEAVLRQDYPDFEVIVILNDCSDRTEDIVRTFPVEILKEEKKGVQGAREVGRLAACGEIIACLDADCLPERHWMSNGLKYLADQKVVAVTGPYDYYDYSPFWRKLSLFIVKPVYKSVHNFLQFLHLGAIGIGGNFFIRSSALKEIDGFDTSISFYGDDTNTAKRLSKIGKVIYSYEIVLKSSARRLKNIGVLNTFFIYIYHFFQQIFFSKNTKSL